MLKIIGIVLLALILILIVIISAKIKVSISYSNSGLTIILHIAKFSFKLVGGKKKKKPIKEEAPVEEPQEEEAPTKTSKIKLENISKREMIDFVMYMLGECRGIISFDTVFADVVIATDNAARTAFLYGEISVAVGIIYPYIENNFSINNTKMFFDYDFDSDKMKWDITISLYTRLIRFLIVTLKNLKHILAFYRKLTKEEG